MISPWPQFDQGRQIHNPHTNYYLPSCPDVANPLAFSSTILSQGPQASWQLECATLG